MESLKTKISIFFRPRQRWLTKQIPNTWIDKDTIFEIVILESIKHYVEHEKCFENLNCDNPPEQAQFLKEVRENYQLITETLPKLEKELEAEWPNVPHIDINTINSRKPGDYEKTYGKINKLEREITNLKTKVLIWAVTNREGMWT